MFKIDTTDIAPIIVEIEGNEYPIAAKTVEVLDKLKAAQEACDGLMQHHLWLAELRVLMGSAAVETLFTNGAKENVDRLYRIHAGVVNAFEHHAVNTEKQIAETRMDMINGLLGFLGDFVTKVEAIAGTNGNG